jgi:hypothetical protein
MFKTEYKFTLPKGYVDKEGTLHREGVMRLANAKDEIAPLSDYRVKQNRAYLVVILLARVITRLGKITDVTPNVVEELFSSDLAYLQSFYRQINEEGSAALPVTCPHCQSEFEVDIGSLGGGSGLGES